MEVIRLCDLTPEKEAALEAEGCYIKRYNACGEDFVYIIHPPRASRREA